MFLLTFYTGFLTLASIFSYLGFFRWKNFRNFWRKALSNPFMIKGLDRCKPFFRIPFKKTLNKVTKVRIFDSIWKRKLKVINRFCIQDLLECISISIKKKICPFSISCNLKWRNSKGFDKIFHLLFFILSRKKRNSCEKFSKNTPNWPNVDLMTIFDSKRDLRCSIVSGLNVGVFSLIFKTTWS